jgi:uncharacterized protein (TIGR01777 family)
MIVVMTGATGLVGRNVAKRLTGRGHGVRALVRDKNRARQLLDCELFDWRTEMDRAFAGADGVIHLAGENVASKRWTQARKRALWDSRIETARELAHAAPGLLFAISASGVGYYGDRGSEVLTENSSAGNDFLARLCVEWENAANAIPAARNVIFRLGVVLSPDGGFVEKVAPMFRRLGASRLGNGRQYFPWIHIQDAAAVIEAAVENAEFNGIYNLTAPEPVTNLELTKELKAATKTWSAPPVPAFALKLIYGELAGALLGSQRAVPERLIKLGQIFRYPSLKLALDPIFSPR